jgi:hypothetical protein
MPAVIPVITAVVGAAASMSASKKAASAAGKASDAQIAAQQAQYAQSRADQAPFMQFGQNQLGGLNKLAAGDYSGFENSPDYLYARDQALYGIDHSAAARGQLYSGGHSLDLAHELNGIASQNLGNYRNSLEWGANLGQNAASGVGQLGANAANQIGSSYGQLGAAQAAAAQQQGGAIGGAVTGIGGALSNYYNGLSTFNQPQQPSYSPQSDPLAGSYTNGYGPGYNPTQTWNWGGS